MAGSSCCERCCCCCCHGNINLVSVMAHLGGWMISIGIICCIFGFTALAEDKNSDPFKVTAMLLCALGVPTCLATIYVKRRVLTLTDGDTQYLRTRDALFDVFVVTGALLLMLGFIFMTIGFGVQQPNKSLVLLYFGVMGCIQFVVGMLDLVFIRVWVRGSQPRTGRGNIIDVILDLRYPVYVFEMSRYPSEADTQSGSSIPGDSGVFEQDLGEPVEILQSRNGTLVPAQLPAAPPTYEQAVSGAPSSAETVSETMENPQFEPPPAYQLTV